MGEAREGKNQMQKIALFGTSADPPTMGHQTILSWLACQFDRVATWVSNNPFKSHRATLEQRGAMLQLLIAEIDPPQPNIEWHPELGHPKTLIVVQRARERWGIEVELTLVIGADLVHQLPNWYQIEHLLRQVKLLIVPRPHYRLQSPDLEVLKHMGAAIAIAPLVGPTVSSTAYREQGDTTAITPKIEAYIRREQLYACQNAAPR